MGKKHCLDCGVEIHQTSIRCQSCDKKGERSSIWKGGISYIKKYCKRKQGGEIVKKLFVILLALMLGLTLATPALAIPPLVARNGMTSSVINILNADPVEVVFRDPRDGSEKYMNAIYLWNDTKTDIWVNFTGRDVTGDIVTGNSTGADSIKITSLDTVSYGPVVLDPFFTSRISISATSIFPHGGTLGDIRIWALYEN